MDCVHGLLLSLRIVRERASVALERGGRAGECRAAARGAKDGRRKGS